MLRRGLSQTKYFNIISHSWVVTPFFLNPCIKKLANRLVLSNDRNKNEKSGQLLALFIGAHKEQNSCPQVQQKEHTAKQ